MDRAAIEELFTFTDYSWREHEQLIRPLGDEKLTEPAPGSGWPALRDALAHINWAYVRWLADPIGTTDEQVERVTSWDELDAYRRSVRDHARRYLDSLGDDELVASREMDVDGERLVYSPADIFRAHPVARAPAPRGRAYAPVPAGHRGPDRGVPVLAARTGNLGKPRGPRPTSR